MLLALTLEAFDPSLGVHAKRVAQLARQIATRLGITGIELRDIVFAAYLHDIGKVSRLASGKSDDKPTQKRGYSKAESGYAILSKVAGFENVAQAVRLQQERFDGKGRPNGLRADRIPLASRIIAVANAFDRAVYTRADPARIRLSDGYRCLEHDRAKIFDPSIVDLVTGADGSQPLQPGQMVVEVPVRQLRPDMIVAREVKNADGVVLVAKGLSLSRAVIDRLRNMSRNDITLATLFIQSTDTQPKTVAQPTQSTGAVA